MNRIRVTAGAAALLLIAIAVAATAGGGGNDKSPAPDKGASDSKPAAAAAAQHHDSYGIYVVDMQTHHVKALTPNQFAQQPSWAPNRKIAFSSALCDECYAKLYRIDAKGVDQRLVQVKVTHLFQPSWSPDGRKIAVVALGRGIFTVDPSVRKARRLTTGDSDEAPAWSPKGDWIAFDKRVGGTNYDLFEVNASSRKVRRITRDSLPQTNPAWSPDGSKLALAQQQRNGKWAVFTMNADGSGRKQVTPSRMSSQEPAWSPDSNRIAFVKQGLDTATIAVIGVNGGSIRVVTSKKLFASRPAWSPDGRSIAFSAHDRGAPEPGPVP